MTFLDYYRNIWKKDPEKTLLNNITNIIIWNFWQMDGLNGTVPLGVPQPVTEQLSLFEFDDNSNERAPFCRIQKWRVKEKTLFKELDVKEGISMAHRKFDVVIGKKSYQDGITEQIGPFSILMGQENQSLYLRG